MMSLPSKAAADFYKECGITEPFKAKRLFSGRNSEVTHLSNMDGEWIIKHYPSKQSNQHDRLATEFGFLTYLENSALSDMTCRPIGLSHSLNQGVYSYLQGIRPSAINSDHIEQAVDFISSINQNRTSSDAARLPPAVDACLSWKDHIALTDSRIKVICNLAVDSEISAEMHQFANDTLRPTWFKYKEKLLATLPSSKFELPITIFEQIISPSDFGFHNSLENNGKLFFLDFEYAGWDDPAKLVCDFICQPELPIAATQAQKFIHKIQQNFPEQTELAMKVEQLLPVHRLKWCCILLNEFRVQDRLRRLHAGLQLDNLLANQLKKSKTYFDTHLSTYL